MKINRKNVSLLTKSEMQNLLGGSIPSEGEMGSGDCNYSCSTSTDCASVCTVCDDVPNWGGMKVCYKGS